MEFMHFCELESPLAKQLAEASYEEGGGGDFEGVAGDEWDDAQG